MITHANNSTNNLHFRKWRNDQKYERPTAEANQRTNITWNQFHHKKWKKSRKQNQLQWFYYLSKSTINIFRCPYSILMVINSWVSFTKITQHTQVFTQVFRVYIDYEQLIMSRRLNKHFIAETQTMQLNKSDVPTLNTSSSNLSQIHYKFLLIH